MIDAAAALLPLIIDTMYLETWRPGEAGHVVVGWELGICRRPGGLATRKSTLVNQVQDHCYRPVRLAGTRRCSLDSVSEVWTVLLCMVRSRRWQERQYFSNKTSMILLREGGTSSSRENVGAELSVGRACGRGCPFSLVSCSFLRLQLAGAFVLYYGVLS